MKHATVKLRGTYAITVEPLMNPVGVGLRLPLPEGGELLVSGTLTQTEKLRDALTRAIEAAREGGQ